MTKHEFTIYLDRQPTDDEIDTLFEAGFDDSLPEVGNGRGMIHVTREASSLSGAIVSAVSGAVEAGFRVVAIDDEDLVSLRTVAERVGRTYEAVRLAATGQRGPGGFPPLLSGDGWSLVSWTAASGWFHEHYGIGELTDERTRTIAAADLLLRARALGVDLSALAPLAA